MSDLRAAIAAALSGGEEQPSTSEEAEGTATAEATADHADATPSSEGGEDLDGSRDTSSSPSSEDADSTGMSSITEEDVPLEYFGTDLSGLPAKERAEIIRGFQERDRHIQRLLREKASEKAKTEPSTQTEPVPASRQPAGGTQDDITDEVILRELGLDPENNPDDAIVAKVAVPLARLYLRQQEELAMLTQSAVARETQLYWETTLDALEAQYGKLPAGITHEMLMEEAARNGISEPVDAYWRIMGPARHDILMEVKKRRDAVAQQLAMKQQPVKPKTSEKTVEENPLKGITDTRSAIEVALKSLAEEKGWDLERADLFG